MRTHRNASRIRALRPRRGFTMIEIMIAITILVMMTAVMVPRMGGTYKRGRLRTAAHELVSTLNYARHTAIMIGDGCEVRIDAEGGRYQIVPIHLDSEGFPAEDIDLENMKEARGIQLAGEALQIRSLPDHVFFSLIYAGAPLSEENGHPRVIYYPDGSATSATIGIQNTVNKAYNVEVYRTTGMSRVEPGQPVLPENVQPTWYGAESVDYRGYR